MIPLRIMLKGFLCYRDEQEVLLDGSSLWMLAGLNGSGKSAVFDAMTFALFGCHRGGSIQLAELINHDSNNLAVEFDFALDRQTYRIRRTLARTARGSPRSTHQISRLKTPAGEDRRDEPGGSPAEVEPIEDTNSANGFKQWVREHIGLSYETFTSSVLLLQGQAEKLLASAAADRFKVLAGIVDLARYQRLHERADNHRKEIKARVEALAHQLDGLAPVTDDDLRRVDADIDVARQELTGAQAAVDSLQDLKRQAEHWAALEARLTEADRQLRASQGLLNEADAIRKDLARLHELAAVLPHLRTAVEKRAEIRATSRNASQLEAEQQDNAKKLQTADQDLEQSRKKLDALRHNREAAEQKDRDLRARLLELTSLLSHVELYDSQRAQLERLERDLAPFPRDLQVKVTQLRRTCDQLAVVERALPHLQRVDRQRAALLHARRYEEQSARQEQSLREKGEQLKKQGGALEQSLAALGKVRQEAEARATEARTLLGQARQQLDELTSLRGAKVCRSCGQALTPEHLQEEKSRREREVADAQGKTTTAQRDRDEAARREQETQAQLKTCQENLEKAREEYRGCRAELVQARKDIDRLGQECAEAYRSLPDAFRQRVFHAVNGELPADWAETTYPTAADLTALDEQARQLSATRRQLHETEQTHTRWQNLHAQYEGTRQNLATLESKLPGNVDQLRREQASASSETSALAARIKSQRDEEKSTQKEIDRLSKARSTLQEDLIRIGGRLDKEQALQRAHHEAVERARKQLPSAWHKEADTAESAELFRWTTEHDKLVRADTEKRARDLEQATVNLEALRRNRAELEAERNRVPEAARVPPAAVQGRLDEAGRARVACEERLRKAERERHILDSRRQQRAQIEDNLRTQEGELDRYTKLSQLLGRERLQRHLVRQAERQVVDHANAVLDRLSGGQLYLRLRGSDDGESAEKALDLEAYNRTTGQAPINVSFLSGSQRFRVAVGLALGLGQYASRQHRPIESVIIDEGFGCLDRQGRQVMIQELQNLRGQLRCILLVSHQEEFADAFPDGYTFELQGGATRVKRFQR